MKRISGLLAATLLAGTARAEVIEVTGEFPASNREASMLGSIAIERIGGQDGPALGIAIERALSGTHFEVLAGRTGRETAEGGISGAVSTGVEEAPFKRKEKQCTSKDKDGKCLKEEQVEINCRRRLITINADLRVVRNSDGRILYSDTKRAGDDVSWCKNERPNQTAEDRISDLLQGIAGGFRMEIAPHVETYRIRVRESGKGMPKDVAKQFKGLVTLSKRDPRGACAGWDSMNRQLPGNASVVFNLGLCAEQHGEYDAALALYREAQPLIGGRGGEAADGADRAMRLIVGRKDAAERARRRS
ncbi:hypothetical protein IAG41_12095 [Sphingomonas sp. JC676]|uniref:hypothetical protein n=1 Tax=Sphingomonas sp. JC676 TaxID=2768065 RepID=UPI0016577AEB|nr:hypothetical protein [Sphingomonas sp. JC676]MBC9033131.1 hypothetical protein [Sphingomonas sp. JC676]